MSCGRKEFANKTDALKALEASKSRVTEIMSRARNMQLNSFKKSVGKTIKEDHVIAAMPRIRISAAKSLPRNSTFVGATKRNIFPEGGMKGSNEHSMIAGLTPGNLSKISATDQNSRVASAI